MHFLKWTAATMLFLLNITVFAQPEDGNIQNHLDSLWEKWENTSLPDTVRLMAIDDLVWDGYLYNNPDTAFRLAQLAYDFAEQQKLKTNMGNALNTQGVSFRVKGDYLKALEYYRKAQILYLNNNDQRRIANILNKIGNIYNRLGDFPKALDHYQKNLVINEKIGNKQGVSDALNNIGALYFQQGDNSSALEYFQKSITIEEELGDINSIGASLNNIGTIYAELKDYDNAQLYYQKSVEGFRKVNNKTGEGAALINIGTNYEDQGDYVRALEYYEQARMIATETGDKNNIAGALTQLGELYHKLGKYSQALSNCQEAWKVSLQTTSFSDQKDACYCLYRAHKSLGQGLEALQFYECATSLEDSIFNEENTRKFTRLEMQYDFNKKEALARVEQEKKDAIAAEELRRQKLVRNGFIGGFAIVLLFAGVFLTQRNRIGKEKQRSENLLLNILPQQVAEELKAKGHSDAQLMDQVTVLFTDFKGFTAMSEQLSPKELVKDLHECFSLFDRICEKYNIEKIKTIGDSYMAASGIPVASNTHAQDIVNAALEMAEVVRVGKERKIEQGLPFFEVRLGVHTGPVVAGIVGVKKFQYDIWGDTVNIASRMESSGEVGKVNISRSTYELLRLNKQFSFEKRGKIKAKGKGDLEMWFVEKHKGF